MPPGIHATARAGVGIVATTGDGRALYRLDPSVVRRLSESPGFQKVSMRPGAMTEERWVPLFSGAMSNAVGEWKPVSIGDGLSVWAYQGQPLYTFVGDHEQGDARGLDVDSARLVVLRAEPKAPSGVTVVRTLIGPVFADSKGMTLYIFTCRTPNPAGLDGPSGGSFSCDNWNDDASYSEQYCPGRDRCAEKWAPYPAPSSTPPQGGTWSAAIIPDPVRYPMRWVPSSREAARAPGAMSVLTYKGHPVYLSKNDQGPAELTGHGLWVLSGTNWTAVLAGVSEER
jgi:predicted lipoprotein with Yx(FWY)xxD motif